MTRRKTATTASLPNEVTNVRHRRTREDPFSTVWEQVRQQIEENPGHSVRKACMGSIDAARRAGTKQAISVAAQRRMATITNVSQSSVPTP